MFNSMLNRRHFFPVLFILLITSANMTGKQSTDFTYQGCLNDNNAPANSTKHRHSKQ